MAVQLRKEHRQHLILGYWGGQFYAGLGWLPHPENSHFVLPPAEMDKPAMARLVGESELEALCLRDEAMIRKVIVVSSVARKRVVILRSLNHMLWYIQGRLCHRLHIREEAAGERCDCREPRKAGLGCLGASFTTGTRIITTG